MSLGVVDGRTIRREKSRQCIIDALIQIVTEGNVEPTAEKVADVAGITMRTVFRHFDDMESLYREIINDLTAQTELLRVAYDPEKDWGEQFNQLIFRRMNIFEKFMPRIIWAQSNRHKSPAINEDSEHWSDELRHSLKLILPKSLVSDADTFAAIEAILGWELWVRLRRDQQLSVKRSRAVIRKMVSAMLNDADI